ncbi:MAG: hypothetical protein ABWY02_14185 [Telluria sp.]
MQRLYAVLAGITLCLAPAADGIAQDNGCGGASFTEATSLSALPVALRTVLATGSPGGRIADVNEAFNSTDVIFDIPDQRFLSGKLTQDCAAVLVELGRGQYRKITIVFRRSGDAWTESTRIVTPPQWRR